MVLEGLVPLWNHVGLQISRLHFEIFNDENFNMNS